MLSKGEHLPEDQVHREIRASVKREIFLVAPSDHLDPPMPEAMFEVFSYKSRKFLFPFIQFDFSVSLSPRAAALCSYPNDSKVCMFGSPSSLSDLKKK